MQSLTKSFSGSILNSDFFIITVDGLSGSGKSTAVKKMCQGLPSLLPMSIGTVGRAAVFFLKYWISIYSTLIFPNNNFTDYYQQRAIGI